MEKPRISEVIVVEGRYDRNTLSQVVDATVVEIGGFAAFRDKEKLELLRRLAVTRGLVIFTDPDGAGFVIRNYLKGAISQGRVLHAYVPQIKGKEKRKKTGGKEGILGVEGMERQVICDALKRAGVSFDGNEKKTVPDEPITAADLLSLGLIGEGSRARRAALFDSEGLPCHLSTKALLEVLNLLYSREEFMNNTCKLDERTI